MKVEKKVISNLNKCYAIGDHKVNGEHCFVVAAILPDADGQPPGRPRSRPRA